MTWSLPTEMVQRRTGWRSAGTSSLNRFLPCLVLLLSLMAAARSRTSSDSRTGLIGEALGLQCPPCERVHCSPRRPSRLRCRGGIVRGVCNCCPVCAKLEGDPCGGQWNYLGRCDAGLYCDTGAHGSKMSRRSEDFKHRDMNSLLKTEGHCRKGTNYFKVFLVPSLPTVGSRGIMLFRCTSVRPLTSISHNTMYPYLVDGF